MEKIMILLGKFSTSTNSYDCHFIPTEKKVQAVGPLPERVGARGVAFEADASSEAEARRKIQSAIESGELK
jgi:hypothetical protein